LSGCHYLDMCSSDIDYEDPIDLPEGSFHCFFSI
jgi:hypothetical protein